MDAHLNCHQVYEDTGLSSEALVLRQGWLPFVLQPALLFYPARLLIYCWAKMIISPLHLSMSNLSEGSSQASL